MHNRQYFHLAAAATFFALSMTAQSVPVLISFEPPTYTTGNIGGQDGWLDIGGPANTHLIQSAVVASGAQAGLINSVGVAPINQIGRIFNLDMTNQTLRVDLQVRIASNSPHTSWSIEPQAPGGDLIAFQINTAGLVQLVGAVTTNTGVAFPYNQWNSIQLDVNFAARTVDAFLNGTPVATNLAFHPNSGTSNIFYGLSLASVANSSEALYFDDLKISSTIEPSALFFYWFFAA